MSYPLKRIVFHNRIVPVVLQNENGPCPLVAIMNVLLLRGQILIRDDIHSIPEADVIQLIADRIVATNPSVADPELEARRASLVSSVLQTLPQLQYGMLIDVKFGGIREFDVSPEMAVFDLLRISCYHGWVLDPQDTVTHSVLDQLSYNAAVEKVVAMQALSDVPPEAKLFTPPRLPRVLSRSMSASTPPFDPRGSLPAAVLTPRSAASALQGPVVAAAAAATVTAAAAATDTTGAAAAAAAQSTALGFVSAAPTATAVPLSSSPSKRASAALVESIFATAVSGSVGTSPTNATVTVAAAAAAVAAAGDPVVVTAPASVPPLPAPTVYPTAASAPGVLTPRQQREQTERVTREGLIAAEFLSATASQLTHIGLQKLHEEIPEGELCVFFRNNHFSTLYKIRGAVFLLLTDVGFGSVADCVWEQQIEIEGNNPFFDGEFRPFRYTEKAAGQPQQSHHGHQHHHQQHQSQQPSQPYRQPTVLQPAPVQQPPHPYDGMTQYIAQRKAESGTVSAPPGPSPAPTQPPKPVSVASAAQRAPTSGLRREFAQVEAERQRQQQQLRDVRAARAALHAESGGTAPAGVLPVPGRVTPSQEETDFQLALRLQEEERAAAGRGRRPQAPPAKPKKSDDSCALM